MYLLGNPSLLQLEIDQLKDRYICEKHFQDDAYVNPVTKNRLRPSAIPIKHIEVPSTSGTSPLQKVKESKIIYTKKTQQVKPSPSKSESPVTPDKSYIEKIINMPSKTKRKLHFEDTPEKKKLRLQVKAQKKLISTKRSHITRLKQRIRTPKYTYTDIENILESFPFKSESSKAFAAMQFKTKISPWKPSEKKISMTLFYKSPATFKALRRDGVVLPGTSTIRKWIGNSKFMPGFNTYLMWQIKLKFSGKNEKDRICSICFDEMSLMANIEYTKELDIIEGLEDLGHLGRFPKNANYALVFMARGIYTAWKLPLAYFLSNSGVKCADLCLLIKEVLIKVIDAGLLPKIIVCDQGTSNQSALKNLGVSCEKPYFYLNEHKIFAIYDTPHLMKSIRNNLLTGDFLLDNKTISFSDIKHVYQIDKKNDKCRALLKITDKHIYPNSFQKMSVKLATQLLSHSVAATIRTCVETGELQSQSASHTADFIDLVDKIFDCLNSKNLFSKNPYSCALSLSNKTALHIFQEGKELFCKLSKVSHKNRKTSRPSCFNGIIQTIQAVLELTKQEAEIQPTNYILTNRLNQDVLENLFSIYRQKGGYNRNPTSKLFRATFRSNAVNCLMKPSGSANCEPDADEMINIDESFLESSITKSQLTDAYSQDSDESANPSSSSSNNGSDYGDNNGASVSLEDCAINYFAGYLAKKCIEHFKCKECENLLTCDSLLIDKNQLLILYKTYDNINNYNNTMEGLKAPSKQFCSIITKCLRIFENNFIKIYHKKSIRKRLLLKLKKNHVIMAWLQDSCTEHKLFTLENMIVVKLYKNCKILNQKSVAVSASTSSKQKIRILKHM